MEIAIAIIGSGLITKLLDVLLDSVKTRKNPMRAGMRFCLLDSLERYGECLIKKGTLTADELKKFNEMYDTYKALDGDGYADKLKEEIDKLTLKVVA